MAEEHWDEGFAKAIGVFLNGEAIQSPDARGERVIDDSFYVLFNAHHEPLQFTLPNRDGAMSGSSCSIRPDRSPEEEEQRHKAGEEVSLESRSLKVLRRAG